jgi:hypothetical protein
MNATYKPTPIDTTAVELPSGLQKLMEKLAENAHDVWAAQRIAQGWTHGPTRDDAAKKHPCLVPYTELPDLEKDYDRAAARETLKVLLKLGCTISEPR